MTKVILYPALLISFFACHSQAIKLPEMADTIQWDQQKVERINKFVEAQLTKALIIYQSGERVYEYGKLDHPYHVFSSRKSVLSVLFGIYSNEINVEATLSELGIEDKLGLTEQEKSAKVVDLLKARSGVYHPAAYETPGMVKNRPKREEFSRDEHWYYNNWDFNALTTIFEKSTGVKVFEAFERKIANPIGMTRYDPSINRYHYEDVSMHPATIWYFSANDFALFGQLMLNKGKWEGKEIIPASWIEESTQPYSNLGILGGYGYCWWAAREGFHYPFVNIPEGTFSARGTGEQNLIVIPEWDMVIVHLTEVTSPEDEMMHVTDFGRLLMLIFEQKFF